MIGSPPNNKVDRMCLLSNIDKYLSCHDMMSFQFVFNKLKNNTYTQIYFADGRAQTFNRRLIFHFRFWITNRRTFFCLKVVSCTSSNEGPSLGTGKRVRYNDFSLYQGFFFHITGLKKIVIPRTPLYGGSLYRGSRTV